MESSYEDILDKVLHSPANCCPLDELKIQMKQCLSAFEDAGEGEECIHISQINSLCEQMGLPIVEDEAELLEKMDSDGSGTLERREWVDWWLTRVSSHPNPAKQQEVMARNVFQKFDRDADGNPGNGVLDMREFGNLMEELGANFSEDELQQAMNELDKNKDHELDMEEFVTWWSNKADSKRSSGGGLIAMKLKRLASKAQQMFYTDIHTASWKGDLNLVQMFLESDKTNLNLADDNEYGFDMTPLHYAAYCGHINIVKELISRGCKVDAKNSYGWTPLFYAAQQGHIDICKTLIDCQADPLLTGYDEEFPGAILCPMDFVEYTKELDSVLRNDKCKVPATPPSSGLSMTLTSSGAVKLIVPPYDCWEGQLKLPLKSWVVHFYQDTLMIYRHELIVKYATFLPKDETPAYFWSKGTTEVFSPRSYDFTVENTMCGQLHGAVKAGTLHVTLRAKNACGISEEESERVLVTRGKESTPKLRPPSTSQSVGSTPRGSVAGSESRNSIVDAVPQSPKNLRAKEKSKFADMSDSVCEEFSNDVETERIAEEEKLVMDAAGEGASIHNSMELDGDQGHPPPYHTVQEGEFSFADMIAQDEALKKASTMDNAFQEGEFSFADMIAQDEEQRKKASTTPGRYSSNRK